MRTLLSVLLRGGRLMSMLAVTAGIVTGVATIAMISIITSTVGSSGGPERIGMFAGAAAAVLVSGAVASNALVRVTQRSTDQLRTKVVGDLMAMPLRHFEAYKPSRALAVLTDDLTAIGQAVQALPLLLINAVVVVSAATYVGILSLPALVVLVVAFVAGAAAYGWAGGRAAVHVRCARKAQDDMQAAFEALTAGFKDLKLNTALRSAIVDEDLRGHSRRHAESVVKGSTITLVAGYWGQMLFLGCVGAIVFAGQWLGIAERDQYAVALAVLYINTPLVTVLNIVPVLNRATVALDRLLDVAAHGSSEEAAAPTRPPSMVRAAALEDAVFTYGDDDETFRLGPVSHVFERGTVTFIVGGNGSGKSTLAKALAGLYPLASGRLVVDGAALTGADLAAYRENVSACFADSYLFGRIRSTDPAVRERMQYWLRELRLHERVVIAGDRFEFSGLSTGQRKRLALVEVLADPRAVVILDEWAAEQDPIFRHRFYHEFLPALRNAGRIVLVVTHDDRYFHACDALLKLERGVQVSPSRALESLADTNISH
ncbi:cyclic peptide export ABC transporter [Nocardia sp. CDC159]|uniref:Cyclic peptide export ABC transporter n=1 Tax=Nocardia pulmonis TaxID=2951408 RepID=A0A9X2ECL4_9NOCA|nr:MULTISPECIES: cyclic peptide export ABC transporter [Nocardia]MCM6778422.1 cyclic peptide export ABC transporter [Nocardia pulmonis]MCM6791311.1 cyclic peptide export ABC transporter [Nocardia sp. CDC159]